MLSRYTGLYPYAGRLETRRRFRSFLLGLTCPLLWRRERRSHCLSMKRRETEREERGGRAECRGANGIPNSSKSPSIHPRFSLRGDALSWVIHSFLLSPFLLLIRLARLQERRQKAEFKPVMDKLSPVFVCLHLYQLLELI